MTPPRLRLICLGDSLTLGIANSELDRWPVQLALGLEKEWPGEYEVYTRANNGATTTDALNKVEGEVGYLLPAIVLVALGVNDALVRPGRLHPQVGAEDFRRNLEDLQRFHASKGAQTIFVIEHVPTPDERPAAQRYYVPGNGRSYPENYAPYREAMLASGRNLQSPVIDLPALIEADGLTSAALVMADGLHLTPAGNAIYARLILQRLREILPALSATIERAPVRHG
jgi:lysophospholipase L1-like esterase